MKADYQMGGGWGNAINWTRPEQFQNPGNDPVFDVVGWKQKIPEVGQTLMGEFTNSFIKFEFVSIERMSNPRDMFFAKVRPIEQEMK